MAKKYKQTQTRSRRTPTQAKRREPNKRYQPRRSTSATVKTSKSKIGLWILTLTTVALFAAGLFYLKYKQPQLSNSSEPTQASSSKSKNKKTAASKYSTNTKTEPKTKKVTSRPKTRFEFYKKLPTNNRYQTQLPEKTRVKQNSPSNVQYTLQIGAFQGYAQADKLRAELTLLGFDTKIKRFKRPQEKEWYRLQMTAPSQKNAEKMQRQLRSQGYKSIVLNNN